MTSTRRLALVLATTWAAAVPTTTAQAAARPCPPAAGHAVAADVDGRVYWVKEAGTPTYYACMTRRRGHRFIGDDQDPDAYLGFRLASPYVAYVHASGTSQGSDIVPTIRNIRTGATATLAVPDLVHAIEVTQRGGLLILWGGQDPLSPFPPKEPAQLLYRSRLGHQTTLDSGAIDRDSLAISRDGKRAYWTKDGLPVTAALD